MNHSKITKTLSLGAISSFAVLSDIHLRHPNENNCMLAIQTLNSLRDVNAVILLGDIFDFIFAPSPFFQKRWQPIFDSLKNLQTSGVKVVFVEGNHDFGFEHLFPKELLSSISIAGDALIDLRHPILGRILLQHGDNIICPPNYLKFRSIIKSRVLQNLVRPIPGTIMQFVFSRWAKISRRQGSYRTLSPSFFDSCVRENICSQPSPPATLILGHVHENIDTKIENTRCIAGPSWLQAPSVLRCSHNGELSRVFLGGKDVPLFPIGKRG